MNRRHHSSRPRVYGFPRRFSGRADLAHGLDNITYVLER
ncbi:hypothetical protein EIB18_09615 [Caulobacter vibrioides]|nr:hypothetical protein CA608_09750 [Caulobacter vibrioides]AZH12941.1 hypothetical protein EIB18_09615 [Caulobacter vibrioides]PLR09554.1 hypothetical protein CVUC_15165 [Caulobacter vibrioides]